MKRTRINPMSAKRRRKLAAETGVRAEYKSHHMYCEAEIAGAPGRCYGELQVHEPWQRSQGGPTDDPRNLRVVCAHHNRMISQDVDTREWAFYAGFSVRRAEAEEWLQAQTHSCPGRCPF